MGYQDINLLSDNASFVLSAGALKGFLKDALISLDRAPLISGASQYFSAFHPYVGSATAGTVAIGNLSMAPFYNLRQGTLDQIAFASTVVAGAGGLARVGIYNADPITRLPTTLLVDGGEIITDGSTGLKTSTINVTLQANTMYWFAYLAGVSAVTVTKIAAAGSYLGWVNDGATKFSGIFQGQAYGALPLIFTLSSGSSLSGNNQPWVGVRFSSNS